MPRYFFHIRDEYGLIEDTEGQELSGENAVLDEIARTTREVCDEPCPSRIMFFVVADAEGHLLHTARIPGLRFCPSLLNAPAAVQDESEIGSDRSVSRIQT